VGVAVGAIGVGVDVGANGVKVAVGRGVNVGGICVAVGVKAGTGVKVGGRVGVWAGDGPQAIIENRKTIVKAISILLIVLLLSIRTPIASLIR